MRWFYGVLAGAMGLVIACSASRTPQTRDTARAPAPTVARAPTARTPSAEPSLAELHAARHLLNRCAFGPRPGEVERVARLGTKRWLDEQLAGPEENPLLEPAMISLASAYLPPADLVEDWLGPAWSEMSPNRHALRERVKPHFREHLRRLATAELTRHILSRRELAEVMTDFWVNHFNTYAAQGILQLFEGDYVERAIRPHALGKFSDLLLATAQHPAMLLYLDNAESRAPLARPNAKRKRRGLNENYARELLELHTLGVDGGYTQDDVIGVARILTGWSLEVRGGRLEYQFKEKAHDRGEKRVLGQSFPAGHGEDEGRRLLAFLAEHPSTARHVAQKLCRRLVADEPDVACIERAAAAYRSGHGDIARVVRSIVESPSFTAPAARAAKLKTPVELVASTARALDAIPDGDLALADVLQRLGEPLLQETVPTGFPESEADWSSNGALLARMKFASTLGSGELRGLRVAWDELAPEAAPPDEMVARLASVFFGERATERTREIVRAEIEALGDGRARRGAAVALLVGSPEFQRQ